MLTKDKLMQGNLKTKVVEIKLLGDSVNIKELSAGTVLHMQSLDAEEVPRYLLKKSLCNEDGTPLFTKGEDVRAFFDNTKLDVIEELVIACNDVSKIGAEVETVKEEAKN